MIQPLSENWQEWPTAHKQALLLRIRERRAEAESQQAVKLRDMVAWRPQPRQAKFLDACGVLGWFLNDEPIQAPAAPLIGYGGAAGGGKTDAFLMLALIVAWAFPGITVTYFRRTYEELDGPEGAIYRSRELFSGIGRYNDSKHRWIFPVGSSIYFRHMHTDKDMFHYQGMQFPLLLVDEATHFFWAMLDYLLTRNRTKIKGHIPFCVMGTNPGNVGHAWFSQVFDVQDLSGGVDGPHERLKLRETPNGTKEKVFFIPARLEDNAILRALDPDYERKLEQRSPDLVEALRWGNWLIFAGMAFKKWRRNLHVIEPFEIPSHWPIWRAVDWGDAKPFCCLWLARDPDSGRVYVIREVYMTGLSDRQQADIIREYSPEDIRVTYADPSMWSEKRYKEQVYSSASEYAARKVILTKANNDRLSGKRAVDRLLVNLPDGKPGLQVFETCTNFIRTVPMLPLDVTRPEDVDTAAEDHAYDALRYGLTNYLLKEKKPKTDKSRSPLLGIRRL